MIIKSKKQSKLFVICFGHGHDYQTAKNNQPKKVNGVHGVLMLIASEKKLLDLRRVVGGDLTMKVNSNR